MLEKQLSKANKANKLHTILTLIGIVLLSLNVVEGWIPQAIVLALATRVLYGWVVVSKLKQENELTSM